MRMGFLFSGLFWGIVVVFIGVSIIVKAVFKIDIPVFRIIFGLLLLYWGVRILFGVHGSDRHGNTRSAVFSEGQAAPVDAVAKEYSTVFGSFQLDLRRLKLRGETRVKASAVFGSMKVVVPDGVALQIKADGVFAGVEFPEGRGSSFGSSSYLSPDYSAATNKLFLEVDTVFGSMEILRKKQQ